MTLAAEVPVNGEWAPNPYMKWSDVDASLPDTAAPRSVVDWTLRALVALSPRVMVGDDWVAEAFTPRR